MKRDKTAAQDTEQGTVLNGSSAILGFYFQTNEAGKQHWEYMAEARMAEVLRQHLGKVQGDSPNAKVARQWLAHRRLM